MEVKFFLNSYQLTISDILKLYRWAERLLRKMVKAAIMGFGVVGSGVYEILKNNAESIAKKAGEKIEVGYILDIRDFSGHEDAHLFTKSFDDILNDDDVKIVIEVMGGLTPAYDYTKKALLAGKNVVTSNKELVATHGCELLKIAKEKNVNYMFEASVGGGIPIIRPMNVCMAANNIKEIYGILNGTTNFILTKMFKEGESFPDALAEAQRLGYAERNPEADVEGFDACRKIAILSSLASGKYINYKDILTEGITKITKTDVHFAEENGYVIKLIGYADLSGGKVFARVSPMLIPLSCQLANVDDVFNAILLDSDYLGEAVFYGRGAGMLPTASAVCADVIDCAKHVNINRSISWTDEGNSFIVKAEDTINKYFVRTNDASLAEKFVGSKILGEKDGETVFITEAIPEKDFMSIADGKCSYIRVMDR